MYVNMPVFCFVLSGRPSESVDVHGVLLLSLLHRGQSLHRAAQVNTLPHSAITQNERRMN